MTDLDIEKHRRQLMLDAEFARKRAKLYRSQAVELESKAKQLDETAQHFEYRAAKENK